MGDVTIKELIRDIRGMNDNTLVQFLRYYGNLVIQENKHMDLKNFNSSDDIFEKGNLSFEDAIEISINQ